MIIALVSQKGGVGKSTLARLLGVEFARAGWSVKVGDLDPNQGTATKWAKRRAALGQEPEIPVQKYRDAGRAIRDAAAVDLMILDGPAQADRSAADMGRAADLVLVPTGYAVDDLDPQAQVAYDMEAAGVDPAKVKLVFCRARGSAKDDLAARAWIARAGLQVLDGSLRELPTIRQAHDMGRAASETGRGSIDAEAKALAGEISRLMAAADMGK